MNDVVLTRYQPQMCPRLFSSDQSGRYTQGSAILVGAIRLGEMLILRIQEVERVESRGDIRSASSA